MFDARVHPPSPIDEVASRIRPAAGTLPPVFRCPLNTDRWFYGVFQSAPDLIRWLAGPNDCSLAD